MFVKKTFYYLVMLSFFTCLSIAIGFAQEEVVNDPAVVGNANEADLLQNEGVQKSLNDVNQVKTFFCNGGEITDALFISAVPGEEKDVCMRFENKNSDDVIFESEFFETSITVSGFPSCDYTDPVNLFSKSIINRSGNTTDVPAGSYVEKSLKLKFPIGYSGLYHFCHYYKILGKGASIPMFNIVVHKSNFMDIFINAENVKLSGSVNISKFNKDKENIFFSLKNEFPFDQEVSFSAVISNVFGFKKEIVLDSDIVRYNTSKDFTINISDLPYYKGPFSMAVKIKYKPRFDFDPKNSGIDQAILDGGEMNQVINFFVFDKVQFIILAVLLIFIFLIKMAFFTKAKVVYVEDKETK